jgi:flagellar basal-body rod protein FlgB
VPTIDSLLGPHLNNIQRALGKATERQSLLTANLANLNTPGYKRKDLDFNIILDDSLHGPSTISQWASQRGERSAPGTSLRQDGNNVDLEREVFAIAETEQRYQVLSEMAISYFSNLKSVIKEGR